VQTAVAAVLALVSAPSGASAEENWPEFRGHQGKGVVDGRGIPDTWSETQNVRWKTALPGMGWSSPIVWGDRVFVTSALGDQRNPEMGFYDPNASVKPDLATFRPPPAFLPTEIPPTDPPEHRFLLPPSPRSPSRPIPEPPSGGPVAANPKRKFLPISL
jgi:hypothetical protein